ncbi:D-alanyl-D-alanine carboxypeptidase (penicillin-binding protein 5/6) [Micromonospora pisi]|uniref:D-alanyl-D-alanine carboxypeptidase (Penicillin-binding protein 5/6) n=1 Tax=Micromonospora pisi TaxID=589240 RepID=A0A495JI04_9ACTN|nr:D-alanyl-D-alanine carboxypeptidase [Micromonospora pisi]RKR88680.1 D-alanyl-D-alanine carboxypeptidase (penicillin-binding protein 5/6) [Micromonospora pisi]
MYQSAPQTPTQPRPRRRRPIWPAVLAPVLVAIALIVAQPLWHQPSRPTADPTLPTTTRIPGTAPQLPWPSTGQAAVAVDGVGDLGNHGTQTPVPIGSVAKVMTAYVVLTDHPLRVGEPGPSLTVSAEQAAAYSAEQARGESLVQVAAGAKFTQREALQAVLLPSANNMARILAAWDAGSVAAFVAKMNAMATGLGMTNTRYTDPAGLAPDTVSTAVDQVILTRKAMALPAFAEIVAQPRATLPVAGTVTNYNHLLGQDGVVGVKTGSTDQAGGCFTFASVAKVGSAQFLVVGAILGQPGRDTPAQLRSVFAATTPLVRAAAAALGVHTVVPAGREVATVRGPLDTGTTLRAGQNLDVIGWPGLDVRLGTEIPTMPRQFASGAEHGRAIATVGSQPAVGTALRADDRLEPPGVWDRLTRR